VNFLIRGTMKLPTAAIKFAVIPYSNGNRFSFSFVPFPFRLFLPLARRNCERDSYVHLEIAVYQLKRLLSRQPHRE